MQSLISTVGLEIEFANVPRTLVRDLAANIGWQLVHDGSCSSSRPCISTIPVVEHSRFSHDVTFGGELVSPRLDTNEEGWIYQVASILELLYNNNENADARTSIHIHVNIGRLPIFAIKQLIINAEYLEAGFYRLACAEAGVHRGALRYDYGYCRPITGNGPPVVYDQDGKYRQIFTTDCIKEATNWRELMMALGRYDRWPGGKYHEARYVWLNPLAWSIYGSTEFRVFNFTSRVRNVVAWVELCKALVCTAFGKGGDLPSHPLGSTDLTIDELLEFVLIKESKVVNTLVDLWDTSDYQSPVMGYQRGHIGHQVNWKGNNVPRMLVPPVVDEQVYDFTRFSNNEMRMV